LKKLKLSNQDMFQEGCGAPDVNAPVLFADIITRVRILLTFTEDANSSQLYA